MKTDVSDSLDEEQLKTLIIESLKKQGFELRDNQICLPDDLNKEKIRVLHAEAVRHKIEERKKGLVRYEPLLLERFASGEEVVPDEISPELIEVHSGSEDELLFRYACLHWSIPVSSGYGRRLRFLVVDQNTQKLMGLFALGDPVFSLKHRDQWIGWNKEDRNERLHHVVDAYVLGAVPPYSFLIGGKLIALLAISNEVREVFRRKYEGQVSVIRKREQSGEIALVTTTSALGRSSIYNRLTFDNCLAFECVGHTQGFGAFHFSNGIYEALTAYAKSNATATASHELWGTGFRNRKEVIRKTLAKLGLPQSWLNHGIKREIYVSPLAKNTCAFLRGDDPELDYYDQTIAELFNWFREEWLIPRSEQNERYKEWNPQELELWGSRQTSSSKVKMADASVNAQSERTTYESNSKDKLNKKTGTTTNEEKESERLIATAIDKRNKLEKSFEDHEISDYLTYEEFIDVCISKRKFPTTVWRSCAISTEAIRSYSNYLKAVGIAVHVFETLIKGINYQNGGAAWIRDLLIELKSEVSVESTAEKIGKERKSNERIR